MDLARRGARVLLLCRSTERGQAAAESIISVINTEAKSRRHHSKPISGGFQYLRNNNNDDDGESGRNVQSVDVRVYQVDLASTSSIRECAKQIAKNETKVDILVNNAGILYCKTFHGMPKSCTVIHISLIYTVFLGIGALFHNG